jgi:uncharacterized circularly permuted ATP-grasp superfamily protein/uncharacterized alpha-E superfamily protein
VLAEPLGGPSANNTPGLNRLDAYPADETTGDLFRGAVDRVAAKWLQVANGLAGPSDEGFAAIHEQVARQILDLGLTFRIAGDEDERDWPLSPMPLIIGAQEWAEVERGLIQRATLLERVAADIYGPQQLVSDGHLPAAVVAGSRYFARRMIGLRPRGGHFIHVYAVDLARGPRGQWRVLGDRLRLANGIGYALENRLALSRSTGALLSNINTRRFAAFFAGLREGIARDCERARPRVALLTPGRFNQSYPEQAHLARYLGLPLVEGRDLMVDESKLYVRTIAGPKRIDAVWRWIDTNALDPLVFDARSELGVPNLFDAWAKGGVQVANWPGVEVLEARAFSAFLPRLCGVLLGEEPILPNVATWWCGQQSEALTVEQRLDELVVTSAFGEPVEALPGLDPVAGASLTPDQRQALAEAMHRRPMDYCGQEIIRLSTTPAMIDDQLVPRPFTLRAFVARGANGEWTVMPGGFARIATSDHLLTSLMGEGEISADVCVVDDAPAVGQAALVPVDIPAIRRGGGILASQAADNLFWFGRYIERAEMTTRVIRSILGSSIEVDGGDARDPEVRRSLVWLLYLWGAITAPTAEQSIPQVCGAALAEAQLPGGVAALIRQSQTVGLSLRERFASDVWRIVKRPVPRIDSDRPNAMLESVRDLIERFSALSGLIAENMVRGPAWRFLEIGRRLERALSICRITRQLALPAQQDDALGVLLDLCDSQIIYRSRYLTGPLRDPVYDLVLLDADNPRSLLFQLGALEDHIGQLPQLTEDNVPEKPLLSARAIAGPLRSVTADMLSDMQLQDTETRLLNLSETIAERYFLHYELPEDPTQGTLLA